MEHISTISTELLQAKNLLDVFLSDTQNLNRIAQAADLITHCLKHGGKIICCGNGGSHADAMHFAEELTGKFREERAPLPAIAIADPTHMSCVSNDYGYDQVFSRYVKALGKPEDVLVGISTSGNSRNVLKAFEEASQIGMKTLALTGNGGGKLAPLADLELRVPHFGYADRIQEMHIKIIHVLILLIEKTL